MAAVIAALMLAACNDDDIMDNNRPGNGTSGETLNTPVITSDLLSGIDELFTADNSGTGMGTGVSGSDDMNRGTGIGSSSLDATSPSGAITTLPTDPTMPTDISSGDMSGSGESGSGSGSGSSDKSSGKSSGSNG